MLTPCIYTIPCYLLAFATLPSSSTATGFPAHTLVELACLLKQLSGVCPAACNWVRIVSKTSSSDAMLFYGSCRLVSYLHCMWVSLVQLKMMAGPGPAHLIFKFKRKQWQSELNDFELIVSAQGNFTTISMQLPCRMKRFGKDGAGPFIGSGAHQKEADVHCVLALKAKSGRRANWSNMREVNCIHLQLGDVAVQMPKPFANCFMKGTVAPLSENPSMVCPNQ